MRSERLPRKRYVLCSVSKQYDVVELHYAFTDTGVNSYRSEKDITLVVATDASTSATAIEAKIKEVLEGSSDEEESNDNP